MTKATSISIKVKPFDFLKRANVQPPPNRFCFEVGGAKPIPIDSDFGNGTDRGIKLYNRSNRLQAKTNNQGGGNLHLCFLLLMKSFY